MSEADIVYSCGACGYDLNLTSVQRMSHLISEDREFAKKDLIAFQSIDLTRFIRVDEVPCLPIYLGRNRSKTKLKCRLCRALIGYGYKEGHGRCLFDARVGSHPTYKKIMIKIRAIQPKDAATEAARNENSQ